MIFFLNYSINILLNKWLVQDKSVMIEVIQSPQ